VNLAVPAFLEEWGQEAPFLAQVSYRGAKSIIVNALAR
jgi:hypothetical protein